MLEILDKMIDEISERQSNIEIKRCFIMRLEVAEWMNSPKIQYKMNKWHKRYTNWLMTMMSKNII